MFNRFACVAVAALGIAAAPASAAGFIGDNVVIKRVQGGSTIFKTVSTAVGAAAEYDDNFFAIDITANEIVFDAVAPFSIGDIFYQIDGLDFDDQPATPNVLEGFSSASIVGTAANPFGAGRVTIDPMGSIKLSFAATTGSSSGLARLTFGAPPPVPEPATWAMMIGGFGFVGGALRSARRRGLALA